MSVHLAERHEVQGDPQSILLNPYPGLRPFAEAEQRLFFGRTDQVNEILDRLERTSFAVVTGGSGSGKSSIVNAGVIPALRKKQLASRGDFWLAAAFSPKDEPFKNLAAELAKLIEPLPGQSNGQLVDDVEQALLETNSLAGFFERYEHRIILEAGQAPESRKSANLLIFCDQFEEIFREQNRDNPEAAQLVDLIVEAYRNQGHYPRLFLMIGMRSEDLHRCAAFIDLPNVINGSVFLARRLDEAEIVSAIVEPMRLSLRLRGIRPERYDPIEVDPWPFDVDVLRRLNLATAAMASDPDHLPLLQHLLSVLWRFLEQGKLLRAPNADSARSRKFIIDSDDLARALGFSSTAEMDEFARQNKEKQLQTKWNESWILKRALDRAAEEVKTSNPRLQSITGRMFRLLAEVDDRGNYKRRWTSRREILAVAKDRGAKPEEVDAIIAAFSDPYPFLNARPGLDGKIDVSHESFIRNWTQFGEWLDNERRLAKAYDMLRGKYLARQRSLEEQGSNPFAALWSRGPSYALGKDELLELQQWRDRRSQNAAWAARYVNGIEGEDPEADRRSADDRESETINRNLVKFYQRGKLLSYKRAVGWGLTAAAVLGFVMMVLEFEQRGGTYNREVTSAGAAVVSENIKRFGTERSGVVAREVDQKLFELTGSEAIVLSAAKSEDAWSGRIMDGYRAATLRTNDPGAFYYVARNSIDDTTRKLLDNAMFPVVAKDDTTRRQRPNTTRGLQKSSDGVFRQPCRDALDRLELLKGVLGQSEELVLDKAKLALAPLEPPSGKQIAAIPTTQGSLVLLLLSSDPGNQSACTVKYLQSLGLPPGDEPQIDDSLHLIAVTAKAPKPGQPQTWVYRVWWSRPCSPGDEATAFGRCATPFRPEITGPALAEDRLVIVDRNHLETGDAKKKRVELRSDHRLTLLTSADPQILAIAQAALAKRGADSPASRSCAVSGKYAALVKDEAVPNSTEPAARTLFVIEETAPKADCQRILGQKIPEKVVATIPLGYFPIGSVAFSDPDSSSADQDELPAYIFLQRSDRDSKNLPIYRIALSPKQMYCLDENNLADARATRSAVYASLLLSQKKLSDEDVSKKSIGMVGACSGKRESANASSSGAQK